MKTFQLTALLISAQMASSALAADKHWAYCHLYEKDYTDEPDEDETNDNDEDETLESIFGEDVYGVKGTLLFYQEEGESLKAWGILTTDEDLDEDAENVHYLGISETSQEDTCDMMGANWPLWFDEDYNYEEGGCALGTV